MTWIDPIADLGKVRLREAEPLVTFPHRHSGPDPGEAQHMFSKLAGRTGKPSRDPDAVYLDGAYPPRLADLRSLSSRCVRQAVG